MLVIKVEMWPYGEEHNKYEIASGKIINEGTGDHIFGDYVGEFTYIVPIPHGPSDEIKMSGEVNSYPRAQGVLGLLNEMLNDMFEKQWETETLELEDYEDGSE